MDKNQFLVLCFVVIGLLSQSSEGVPTPTSTNAPPGNSSSSPATVKILIPSPSSSGGNSSSSSFDDEDDAVIIDADDSSPPVDLTPDSFNTSSCLLKPVKGPCRAVIEQWFYNPSTSSCQVFQWSGCGGNNNRFSEKEFCDAHCTEKLNASNNSTKSGNKECPPFKGCGPLKCGVSLDPRTGCEKCDCEVLGSVSGNPEDQNQQSHVAVNKEMGTTDNKPEEVCLLPETRANCRAMMTRWRYEKTVKHCVQFHFGGCDHNPNNFVSEEKCIEFCKGQ